MTVDDLKKYLRVDGSEDDALITSLQTAAAAYINKQTGKTTVKTGTDSGGLPVYSPINTDELWCLTVKMLVAHWYDNRGAEISGNTSRISHSVDTLVNHISMCGDYV